MNTQETVTFTLDGKSVSVPKGTTVYTAAKMQGIEIPIFCYQDRMPPFGACRMCLVEVEKMPKLQTSCTLVATEGMVVNTSSQNAEKGREGILELLLINHPLDCPICDRGGECPLQDQTLKYGPGISQFFEEKRHFDKPLPLGPVLMLDRERCVVCARCTRFGEIIAGDHALEFIDRGYRTEVGTPDGGPAESKFIGNTIMICPVGALTSNVYRFRARPWDNDSAESACTLCPVGCSMHLDSRDGEIVRTRSKENKDVNDIWMCDKGWFGYEFTYSPDRLVHPLVRKEGVLQMASWEEALTLIGSKIKEAKPSGKLAGWGGNPLTVEENYLFQKLMREGAGVNHIDHRIGMPIFNLEEEGMAAGMEMSIGECENLKFAVLLGLDLTEEFPVIWLRLKQAINNEAKVTFIGHYAPEISPHLEKTIVHAPGAELDMIKEHLAHLPEGKGAIFVGRQYLASPNRKNILSELLKIRKDVSLNLLEGRGNSMGARYAGMHPELGPYGKSIDKPGLNALQLIEKTVKEGWDFLYVAGADPATKYPEKAWGDFRSHLKFLVVQDLFLTQTAMQADVVLPAHSFVEKEGSFINIEGRVQKLHPGKRLPENLFSDGEIFNLIAYKLNLSLKNDFKLPEARLALERPKNITAGPVTHQEGSLKATFAPVLFDHGVRMKHNRHVIQLAKEPLIRLNPADLINRGLKDGDTVAINTIRGKVKFDPKVAVGTAVIPLGFPELQAHELGLNLLNGMNIQIVKS